MQCHFCISGSLCDFLYVIFKSLLFETPYEGTWDLCIIRLQKIKDAFLLVSENILIGCGSLIVGLVLGAIMHKGIVYGTTALLNLSIDNSEIPFFNFDAITNTVVFIFLIMFVMAISNALFLFKTSLMDLVRFEKSAEKRMVFKKHLPYSALF